MEDDQGEIAYSEPSRSASWGPPTRAIAWILTLLAVQVLLSLYATFFTPKPAARKWEYHSQPVLDIAFSETTNLGAEGWELVYARRPDHGPLFSPALNYELILKRPESSQTASNQPN